MQNNTNHPVEDHLHNHVSPQSQFIVSKKPQLMFVVINRQIQNKTFLSYPNFYITIINYVLIDAKMKTTWFWAVFTYKITQLAKKKKDPTNRKACYKSKINNSSNLYLITIIVHIKVYQLLYYYIIGNFQEVLILVFFNGLSKNAKEIL